MKKKPKHDLTGRRFGWLEVLRHKGSDKRFNATWECRCLLCERTHVVPAPSLLNGCTKSCGCLWAIRAKANRREPKPAELVDPGRLMWTYRNHARLAGVPFDLSDSRWLVLVSGNCHYCGKPPAQRIRPNGMLYNGVDKMDRLKGYVEGNVVSCCKQCNLAKGKMTHDEFVSWVISVYDWLNP